MPVNVRGYGYLLQYYTTVSGAGEYDVFVFVLVN